MHKYMHRIDEQFFDEVKPVRRGQNVTLTVDGNSSAAVIGALFALFVPVAQAARTAIRNLESEANIRAITLSLMSYAIAKNRLP